MSDPKHARPFPLNPGPRSEDEEARDADELERCLYQGDGSPPHDRVLTLDYAQEIDDYYGASAWWDWPGPRGERP